MHYNKLFYTASVLDIQLLFNVVNFVTYGCVSGRSSRSLGLTWIDNLNMESDTIIIASDAQFLEKEVTVHSYDSDSYIECTSPKSQIVNDQPENNIQISHTKLNSDIYENHIDDVLQTIYVTQDFTNSYANEISICLNEELSTSDPTNIVDNGLEHVQSDGQESDVVLIPGSSNLHSTTISNIHSTPQTIETQAGDTPSLNTEVSLESDTDLTDTRTLYMTRVATSDNNASNSIDNAHPTCPTTIDNVHPVCPTIIDNVHPVCPTTCHETVLSEERDLISCYDHVVGYEEAVATQQVDDIIRTNDVTSQPVIAAPAFSAKVILVER